MFLLGKKVGALPGGSRWTAVAIVSFAVSHGLNLEGD